VRGAVWGTIRRMGVGRVRGAASVWAPRRGAGAACWLALALLWLHFGLSLPPTARTRLADFAGYYDGARVVLAGEPERLYDADRQWFTNLPVVAVALAPLGRLDYPDAWRVFWWSQLASLAASFALLLWALARHYPPLTPARALAAAAVFLCFAPVMRRCLFLGQSTPSMLLLLLLAYLLARGGRPLLAGGALGVVCLVKIPPLLLLPLLVLRRRLAIAAAAAAVVAAGVALSLLLFEPGLTAQYWERGFSSQLGRASAAFNNRSLAAAFMRAFTWQSLVDWDAMPMPPSVVAALGATLGGLGALLFARGGRALLWPPRAPCDDDRRRGSLELELALGVGLMLLVPPVVWIHYYLFLAVPLVLLPFWWAQRGLSLPAWVALLLVAGGWLASGSEVLGNHYYGGEHQWQRGFRLLQDAQTLGALLIVVALSHPLAEIARRERGARPPADATL